MELETFGGCVLRFRPAPTEDRDCMRRQHDALRRCIRAIVRESGRPVRVIFDLRHCSPSLAHVEFACAVLWRSQAFMEASLWSSVAILPCGALTKTMCDLFLSLYRPVRPFAVESSPRAAVAFLMTCDEQVDSDVSYDEALERLRQAQPVHTSGPGEQRHRPGERDTAQARRVPVPAQVQGDVHRDVVEAAERAREPPVRAGERG